MAKQDDSMRTELLRPAKRPQPHKTANRRKVAGSLKAFVGPRTLGQALDHAVSPRRRQEIVEQSGYDAHAQKLTFEPYLRALLVRQIEGGSLHDLQAGMARDPLYQAHGAQLEISVPGLSKANAQRSPQPFWDVLAEVMAAVDALPQAVRLGRGTPLAAATPKQLREMSELLERTHIFDGTTVELPPQIAQWARTSTKQERAGIKVQLRLRAGYGGLDRVMVTGGRGNDNPYFCALLDLETAAPGQVYLFDTGSSKLATYEAIRQHGSELVSILPASLTVAIIEEREIPTAVTAQGYTIHSDRIGYLGTGKTRSAYRWRVIEATDTQGQRRTIVSSLLEESAERLTQLRAYRWTIEIVFRWLKRVLQLDTLISYSPGGIQMQVAVALLTYGILLLYHAGGALSLKALRRRVKQALHEALFAAGVAEGERRAQERKRRADAGVPLLRATG
jgi:hypothetical protein